MSNSSQSDHRAEDPGRAQSRSLSEKERNELLRPFPRIGLKSILVVVLLFCLYSWSITGTDAQPSALIEGLPHLGEFLGRLVVTESQSVGLRSAWAEGDYRTFAQRSVQLCLDKFEFEPLTLQTPEIRIPLIGVTLPRLGTEDKSIPFPTIVWATLETLQMAIIGTTAAIILAAPFGLLAARNVSPHPLVYHGVRFFLNVIRAIPDLVFGLIFVAAVGLGPFSGVLALAVGSIGSLGKMFAESVESVDSRPLLAIRATGASRLHTFAYGVIPQAMPSAVSYAILMFEHNVRSATILGLVGAGGVGFEIDKYIRLFQYQRLMGAMIVVILVVTIIDRFSDRIRKSLI